VFSSRPCKWYLQGNCHSGDKCLYLHDGATAAAALAPAPIACRFYDGLPGSCRNGESCPYSHSDPASNDHKSSDPADSAPGEESEEDGDLVVFKMS
jgi:hypothetical protein